MKPERSLEQKFSGRQPAVSSDFANRVIERARVVRHRNQIRRSILIGGAFAGLLAMLFISLPKPTPQVASNPTHPSAQSVEYAETSGSDQTDDYSDPSARALSWLFPDAESLSDFSSSSNANSQIENGSSWQIVYSGWDSNS